MKLEPQYIMVPRKFIIAWIVTFVVMIVLTGVAIQWANYVDQRSNRRWCGIVQVFDEEYNNNPPKPNTVSYRLAPQFKELEAAFKCK